MIGEGLKYEWYKISDDDFYTQDLIPWFSHITVEVPGEEAANVWLERYNGI